MIRVVEDEEQMTQYFNTNEVPKLCELFEVFLPSLHEAVTFSLSKARS